MNSVKKDHSVGEGSGALAGAMAGVAVGSVVPERLYQALAAK